VNRSVYSQLNTAATPDILLIVRGLVVIDSMDDDSGVNIKGPDSLKGALLYILIGIAIISYGGYDYVQQTEAVRESVEVDATITELDIEADSGTSSNPGANFDPVVEFEYTYNGTEYTGSKIYPADIEQNYETQSGAESAIEEYEQGAQTTAYVSPDEPGDAFLKNQTSNAPIIAVVLGGLFTLFAAVSAVRKL
jgi:hypothetical protein